MGKTAKRKCNKCKKTITIHRDDIKNVIYYCNFYYHTDCLIEEAQHKLQSKRNNVKKWNDVLDNIQQLEADTKEMLRKQLFMVRDTDPLNDYLLEHYNVTAVDKRVWQTVRDLENGIYRKRRCKKIDVDMLYEAWQWGQRNLDEIARKNKMNNKGPKTDDDRILYDLAILVGKIPMFLSYKKKQEDAKQEMSQVVIDEIDMSRVGQRKYEARRDISDIADDLFVE